MPESRASEPTDADRLRTEIWRAIAAAVIDSRDQWRRDVVATTGLPFSRYRVLRRVARKPMTLKEVAHAAMMDAPAASVAVSDLESAGYVTREPSPTDRRSKHVLVTDAGRTLLDMVNNIADPPPETLMRATPEQLAVLHTVFGE
ncbi:MULTISPECIES: MarR family winged helix-turn-helix transcriptional regulator [unclassified Gordonia (in: high G+C Gram-positive bacteria)]